MVGLLLLLLFGEARVGVDRLNHLLGINEGTNVEDCPFYVNIKVLQGLLSKDIKDELLDGLNVVGILHFLLELLITCLLVKQDGEYFPNIPQEILVDALVSNN